jgi:hypothetical protein
MPALLAWLRRRRTRRLHVAAAPADVLLQSVAVLRHFGARVLRCDVEDGTLEARLAAGARLTVAAMEDGAGSRVTVETDGADWHGVGRTLESELARGGGSA